MLERDTAIAADANQVGLHFLQAEFARIIRGFEIAAGGDPFLGQPKQVNAARYLAGGTPFGPPGDPNTPVSRKLTPRANGLPPNVTWAQFLLTMRTGRDLKNRLPHVPSEDNDLLQVMPWPVFQGMTDRDLRAIYEYLRTIPPLPSAP